MTPENKKRLNCLRQKTRSELKRLFRSLPAPRIEELNGEYDAVLLHQGNQTAATIIQFLFNLRGRWLGKAFTPLDESEGVGYNRFQTSGGIINRYRMRTYIDQSNFSEGESYFLEYRDFNPGIMRTMVGELRKVSTGLYLGMGELGPESVAGVNVRRKIFFSLVGPVAPFRDNWAILYCRTKNPRIDRFIPTEHPAIGQSG